MQINPNFCVCEDGERGRINHKADVERIISMALCTTISKTNEVNVLQNLRLLMHLSFYIPWLWLQTLLYSTQEVLKHWAHRVRIQQDPFTKTNFLMHQLHVTCDSNKNSTTEAQTRPYLDRYLQIHRRSTQCNTLSTWNFSERRNANHTYRYRRSGGALWGNRNLL